MADTVSIPAERLVPIATEAASRAKTVASVLCFFLALFAMAAIGVIADHGSNATRRSMDAGSMAVGMGIWFLVLGSFASRYLKTSRRATEVTSLAKGNVGHQFFLDGRQLVTTDPTGAPQPALTFKLSAKLCRQLVEVPRATVRH